MERAACLYCLTHPVGHDHVAGLCVSCRFALDRGELVVVRLAGGGRVIRAAVTTDTYARPYHPELLEVEPTPDEMLLGESVDAVLDGVLRRWGVPGWPAGGGVGSVVVSDNCRCRSACRCRGSSHGGGGS